MTSISPAVIKKSPSPNKKVDKLAQYIAENIVQTSSSNNGKDQKVVEFYLEMLAKHKRDLGKNKLTVWMQVGSFFEVYGIKYPDGTLIGNVWDVARDLDIKVALKSQSVYGNAEIEVYMAGVKEEYTEPYIERLVDKNGWTVALYTQEKIGSSGKFERVLKQIISPGLSFETDAISNNFMYIYFKSDTRVSRLSPGISQTGLYIGIYYVDCISGDNGAMELFTKNINEYGVVFSELVKLITIKNPTELVIHLDVAKIDKYKQFSEQELFCNLSLFDKSVRYIKDQPAVTLSIAQQTLLLEKAYQSHKGRMTIFQQLGIDNQFDYGRIAICLALTYIFQHDTGIIQLLDKPVILASSNAYMMLANNCLQQLDIIDPTVRACISQLSRDSELIDTNKIGFTSNKRLTLLDILDKTKSVIGKRLFRQRLSIPITSPVELNTRYDKVSYWQNIQRAYLSTPGRDMTLSPIRKIRSIIDTIGDIPKFIRKLATDKFLPANIQALYMSLKSAKNLAELITNLTQEKGDDTLNLIKMPESLATVINKLEQTFDLKLVDIQWNQVEANFFAPGVCPEADKLNDDIETDTKLFELLKAEFGSQNIVISEDTNVKLGRYLWINDKNKAFFDEYVSKHKDHIIKLGHYEIKMDSIIFDNLKKGRWQLNIPCLYLSSKNLSSSIEQLRKVLRTQFSTWQCNFFKTYVELLNKYTDFIGEIDVIQSCVYVADNYGYHRPVIENIVDHSYLKTTELRHPIVERIRQDVKYIANDLHFGLPGQYGMLLFGLNSSGKSTTMKAVGCALIMAQAGMFVPAMEFVYWPYQYLFTRIRNNDDIYAGLSSFEVEMKEFKVILNYADVNGMILGDELCSGTETLDATALVASGLQQLCKKSASFIFATHLHFLSEIESVTNLDGLKFYHLAVNQDPNDPDKLIYDRKLKPGNGPQSYGILVCKSMGLDKEFIRDAEKIRNDIEAGNILKGFSGRLGNTINIVGKPSHFNKDKVFQVCEVCGVNPGEDIHHIGQQAECNSCGILADGTAHKNSKWNLTCLCKSCHNSVHIDKTLNITGYIQTSRGIELKYTWITADTIVPNPTTKVSPKLVSIDSQPDITKNGDERKKISQLIQQLRADGKTIRGIQTALRNKGYSLKLVEIENYTVLTEL